MSEEGHLVGLVETGVVAAVPDHELVAHLVVDAALAPFDEQMMVGAVRRGAVHAGRVQVDGAHGRGRAHLELVAPALLDHPAIQQGSANRRVASRHVRYRDSESETGESRPGNILALGQ